MANGRTGLVFLEDFDVGLAETIGGELVDIVLDGETVQTYALRVAGVTGPKETQGLVPIVMSDSEESFVKKLLPQIVISRGDISPDMARWFPGGHEYMIPAHGSTTVTSSGGLQGPSRVEIKAWSYPYEISYDVHLRTRLRRQGDLMFKQVGRILWKYGQIWLMDSEGERRGYYAFNEGNSPLGSIDDIGERLQGHTISLRVEAELDFLEPIIAPTTPKFEVRARPRKAAP